MEIMKAELESGAGGNADGVSSYQVKQLEQQNEKLKEALVKYVVLNDELRCWLQVKMHLYNDNRRLTLTQYYIVVVV